METNIFDIETAPYSDEDILKNAKAFDPADVRVGNLKDPDKIQAKLDAAEDIYHRNLLDKAALDPHTSSICAIGFNLANSSVAELLVNRPEKELLEHFWGIFESNPQPWGYWSGSNDKTTFDPRHLIIRSWKLKVKTPWGIVSNRGYLSDRFVDISQVYLFGASYPSYCSADKAAEQLGLIGKESGCGKVKSKQALKNNGVDGKTFYKVLETDSVLAREYLKNDIAMERAIADRIL